VSVFQHVDYISRLAVCLPFVMWDFEFWRLLKEGRTFACNWSWHSRGSIWGQSGDDRRPGPSRPEAVFTTHFCELHVRYILSPVLLSSNHGHPHTDDEPHDNHTHQHSANCTGTDCLSTVVRCYVNSRSLLCYRPSVCRLSVVCL